MRTIKQPDIDICRECGEHAEFGDDGLSNCCGARPYDADPYLDMDRRGQSYLRAAVMVFSAMISIGCASAPVAKIPTVAEQPLSQAAVNRVEMIRALSFYQKEKEMYCYLLTTDLSDLPAERQEHAETIKNWFEESFSPFDCPPTAGEIAKGGADE